MSTSGEKLDWFVFLMAFREENRHKNRSYKQILKSASVAWKKKKAEIANGAKGNDKEAKELVKQVKPRHPSVYFPENLEPPQQIRRKTVFV